MARIEVQATFGADAVQIEVTTYPSGLGLRCARAPLAGPARPGPFTSTHGGGSSDRGSKHGRSSTPLGWPLGEPRNSRADASRPESDCLKSTELDALSGLVLIPHLLS